MYYFQASAIGSKIIENNGDVHDYISKGTGSNFFFNVLTFVILYNNLIPISLQVTLEFVKFIQAYFINSDLDMYHEETDTFALARTSNLNEELGQIRYVFSDKTGTLTQNVMKFKECTIAGLKHSTDTLDSIMAENELQSPDSIAVASSVLPEDLNTPEAKLFFTVMAVCHTVIPEVDSLGETTYNASSPDEKALVEGAAYFGYKFSGRKPESVIVNDREEYKVLDTIEFTSARKRMSCVVRFPNGKLKLLIKGADMMINDR